MNRNLRRLAERFKDDQFAIVSISVDPKLETVIEYLREESMPWTHWFNGDEGGIIDAWNIQSLPTIFVLDSRGVVRYRGLNDDNINKCVKDLTAARQD